MNNLNKLLAQASQPLGTIGKGEGFGLLNNITSGKDAIEAISKIASTVIGFITITAGVYLIFQLLTASLNWMTASGDKGKLEKAQMQITQSLTGIIMIVAAYAIVSIVGTVLGLDVFLGDPQKLIDQLKLGGP